MADIAMLVAEEYERRVKNSRKSGSVGGGEEIDFFYGVSALAQKIDGSSNWVKRRIGEERIELIKWVLEPRTQIGVAAINGLFSA